MTEIQMPKKTYADVREAEFEMLAQHAGCDGKGRSLNLLLHAMDGAFTLDGDGNHVLVGADFTVQQVLDFYSGCTHPGCTQEEVDIDCDPALEGCPCSCHGRGGPHHV